MTDKVKTALTKLGWSIINDGREGMEKMELLHVDRSRATGSAALAVTMMVEQEMLRREEAGQEKMLIGLDVIVLDARHTKAVREMAAKADLSPDRLIRLALATYQMDQNEAIRGYRKQYVDDKGQVDPETKPVGLPALD